MLAVVSPRFFVEGNCFRSNILPYKCRKGNTIVTFSWVSSMKIKQLISGYIFLKCPKVAFSCMAKWTGRLIERQGRLVVRAFTVT